MTEKVLVLRNCRPDMTAFGGFKWPTSGPVEAPDWDPSPTCGGGLHGWLMGQGDGLLGYGANPQAVWLVVEVWAALIVDLSNKVKFPRGNVVFCGSQADATCYIRKRGGLYKPIIGLVCNHGNDATVIGGDSSQLNAGDRATLTVGRCSLASVGHSSVVIGRNGLTVEAGDKSVVVGGESTNAVCGNDAVVCIADYGVVTAKQHAAIFSGDNSSTHCGDNGVIIGGVCSTLRGGRFSYLVGNVGSRFCGGEGSVFVSKHAFVTKMARVGFDGIEPDVYYQVSYSLQWEKVDA